MKKLIVLIAFLAMIPASAQEKYILSDRSTLAIDGTSTLHDWTVTAHTMDGKIVPNGTQSAIDFSVPVDGIRGDRAEAMNKKMHEALKKETHPKVIVSVKELDTSVTGEQQLNGTLIIAGVEKEVSIPATISKDKDELQITGEKKIILQDYGMKPPTAMFGTIVVGDEVTVKFDLLFESR